MMPLRRLSNGRYRAISYVTGRPLGPVRGESKVRAEARSRTSKRRSRRVRSTRSRRATSMKRRKY